LFERLIKAYLKWTGKKHLIPFLDGLINIGRPGTVFFPMELIEQGVGLVLSGLNNTLATQSHPDWVWPWWLERQQDPDTAEFTPTGVNLLTANLTHRNWISFGLPESSRESMLDPVGMLTLHPFGWSIIPYVRLGEKTHLPQLLAEPCHQSLAEGCLPMVRTEYAVSDAISWHSETFALRAGEEDLVYFANHLENRTAEPIDLVFGHAIRPYNMLALGHINKLKYKNRLWRVNRKPGFLLMDEPDRVIVADRHLGDPLLLDPAEVSHRGGISRSGILSGISELDLTLAPGASRCLVGLGILTREVLLERKFRHLTPEVITTARAGWLDQQRARSGEGMVIEVPDAAQRQAFYAIKNHLHVFDDQKHFSPGTFFYHNSWIRDSAFIALAFENVGFGERVAPKMASYLKMQSFDGFFRSQNGEWDSAGQALWTMIDHVRRNGTHADLERYWGPWRKGVRWIEDQCRRSLKQRAPHAGLLPAGFSAEHFGPNDHYFWDNIWALAGIREVIWVAEMLGRDDERLVQLYEEYRYRVEEIMTVAANKNGSGALPSSPYRMADTASIGNLVAVSPLDLFTPEAPWFRPTVDFLYRHNLRMGLFFQKIIHTGMNAYLSVQLARALLALGDSRWREILSALLAMGAPTYTWPEAIHPGTMGGCMGDGDHGWASAEVLGLIRDTLVREERGGLVLASGIILDELEEPVVCRGASTRHGVLDYHLTPAANGLALTWELSRGPLQQPVPIHIHLPQRWSIEGGNGPDHSGRPKLIGDSGTVTLVRAESREEVRS